MFRHHLILANLCHGRCSTIQWITKALTIPFPAKLLQINIRASRMVKTSAIYSAMIILYDFRKQFCFVLKQSKEQETKPVLLQMLTYCGVVRIADTSLLQQIWTTNFKPYLKSVRVNWYMRNAD